MKKVILFFTLFSLSIQYTYTQWVQQSLPVSGLIYDICFFDANTGLVSMDTPALLRTTNGGANWEIVNYRRIYNIKFVDNFYGYANGRVQFGGDRIYKTTDGGNTWDSCLVNLGGYGNLTFMNRDTGWICGYDGSSGAVWRTTNGGQTMQQQLSFGSVPIQFIFFAKQKYGNDYYGWYTQNGLMSHTTNSGVNWNLYTNLPNQNAGTIAFINKDTGWVTNLGGSPLQPYIMHTTDNGMNWTIQNLPYDWNLGEIQFINSKRGWGGGGFGHVYATTNGGVNWGFQAVPTISQYQIFFLDSLTGWCGYNGLAKTSNGGGNIIYQGIQQIGNEIPVSYKLFQNYPNPFNSTTNFKFQIPKSSYVKIILYDILGRALAVLVDEYLNAGTYKVVFDATMLSSGVLFYRLITDSYTNTKKMILVK